MENSQPTGLVAKNYVPPKMWKDLTDAEKIVRLREEVKNKDWQISNLQQRVSQMESLVKNHLHLESGEVVQKVNSIGLGLDAVSGNSLKSVSGNPDDIYF